METSKEDFCCFVREFEQWQNLLGLTDYHCTFLHEPTPGSYGDITVDHPGKVARVRFGSIQDDRVAGYDPKNTGRHEALELLMARFDYLARARYLFPEDIEEERHAVIRRIEHLVDALKVLSTTAH